LYHSQNFICYNKFMTDLVLLIGNGAREHAIAWKLKLDNPNIQLFIAPGNAGTAELGTNTEIGMEEIDQLLNFALTTHIDFTIVGNELPLAKGIVNLFQEKHLKIFGHTKEAAMLESDKGFAVEFMRRHHIPHPASEIFSDFAKAEHFIRNLPWKEIVIKASGLASGKGVILPDSQEEALDAIHQIMVKKIFGEAGEKVVMQERLNGYEASIIGFVSNEIGLLVPAQDYKRVGDGDVGPNTGGMGAYAPNANLTPEMIEEVRTKILVPTVAGMREEGRPLSGALYAGIMLTENGPKVIEYNLRFGDPETQVQMRLLESNLLESMKATASGTLTKDDYRSRNGAAVGVVIAAEGYPGSYAKDHKIHGVDTISDPDIVVFHAGTRIDDEKNLVSTGGRVATVTATGATREQARQKVYDVLGDREGEIMMENGFYRNDIASQT
jgi:phosphoribosylamine---glycine ligase